MIYADETWKEIQDMTPEEIETFLVEGGIDLTAFDARIDAVLAKARAEGVL